MGAVGGRGVLLAAAETGGFELATRSDAMLTQTSLDDTARAWPGRRARRTGSGWSWKAAGASRGQKAEP